MSCNSRTLSTEERAAWLAANGLRGRRLVPATDSSVAAQKLYHNAWYSNGYVLVCLVLLVLALWEPPGINAPSGAALAAMRVIDALCLLAVTADLLVVQLRYLSSGLFFSRGWTWAKLGILGLLFVNLIVSSAVPSFPYVMRIFRPVFLVERLRPMRQIAANVAATLPKIVNVMMLLAFHVFVFGTFGYVLFAGMDRDGCVPTGTRADDQLACR